MWVTWVMIGLAVIMVIGPIMMIQPSPRQKRIAKLRTVAAENHLLVKLGNKLSKSDAPCVAYIYPFQKSGLEKKYKNLQEWTLEKRDYSHDIHFCGPWEWQGKTTVEPEFFDALYHFVSTLPDEFTGVGLSSVGVFLHWNERCETGKEQEAIQKVSAFLEKLHRIFMCESEK